MTLMYEFDLDSLKIYNTPKVKFIGQEFRKLESKQDRHTQRRGQTHYHSAFADGNEN